MKATREQVEQFARAVLIPGMPVRVLQSDNLGGSVTTLEAAISIGDAFIGTLRDGIVAFDCDPEADPSRWARLGRSALEAVGCNVVRVASGSAGAEHWWFISPVGWTTELLRAAAGEAGVPAGAIRWKQRSCRSPLSPHRLGLPVSLVEPTDPADAVRLLRRPHQTELDEYWRDSVLDAGAAPDGRYADNRSAATMALALAYVNAGREFEQFDADVRTSSVLGPKLKTMSPAGADKWLHTTWDKACAKVRADPPRSQLGTELALLHETARQCPWKGASGDRDRIVFGHLLDIAEQAHDTAVSRSIRSLQELTGLSRATVRSALRRLVDHGLIAVVRSHGLAQARTYQLLPQPGVSQTNSYLRPPTEVAIGSTRPNFGPHDLSGAGAASASASTTRSGQRPRSSKASGRSWQPAVAASARTPSGRI